MSPAQAEAQCFKGITSSGGTLPRFNVRSELFDEPGLLGFQRASQTMSLLRHLGTMRCTSVVCACPLGR